MSTETSPPEKSRKPGKSGRFKFLIGLVIVISVAYSAAWLYGSHLVRTQIEQAMAGYATSASSANCGNLGVGGFPFRFDVTCSSLEITEGDVAISLPRLQATVLVYRPTHLLWFAEGPLSYTDAFTGARQEVRWTQLRGSLRTFYLALSRLSVEGEDVRLVDTLLGEREIATIAHVEAHALDMSELWNELTARSQIAVLVDATGINMAELEIADGAVRLEAEVPGVPDDIRRWSYPTFIVNWRDDPINLIGLHAEDARSQVEVVGTIGTTLDAHLTGDFDLTTRNLHELLAEFIAPQMLGIFLGQQSDDGSYYRSYSIRDGVLLAGNLPVLVTPPLI